MDAHKELTHGEHLAAGKPLLSILAGLPPSLLQKEGEEYVYASLLSSIAFYLDSIAKHDPSNWARRYREELKPLIDSAEQTEDFRKLDEFLVRFYIDALEKRTEGNPQIIDIIELLRDHLRVVAIVIAEGPIKKFNGRTASGVTIDDYPDWWLSACETDALAHIDEL